jgi:hypothetical protein
MLDVVLRQFRDQGAWVLRDRKYQGQAHPRVRVGGQRGKRRGSLGGEYRSMTDLIRGINRGQTSDGALAHAAFTTSDGDDLFHVWDPSLGWEAATRHYRGITTLRKSLR